MQVAGDFAPAEISMDNAPIIAVEALVEDDTPNGFVELGLAAPLVQAVKDLGYVQPTVVQKKAIPLALPSQLSAERGFMDLMVSSQTGSGKTAAFLLPVLHTLIEQQAQAELQEREEYERAVADAAAKGEAAPKRAKRKDPTNPRNFKAAVPGALIVCPTRELAQQVAHDAIDLVKHCRGIRIANIVGGMPYQLQIAKLQNANLVVATPGRLLDLQRSMQIKLDQVQFLVVDEADRMLDLGFSDDLAEINQLTSQRRQTMMFSATFAPRIQQLAMRVMHDNGAKVQRVTIDNPQEKHVNIKQSLFWADNAQHKRKLLDHWLRDASIDQAIVFASTQVECDGLANDLQQDGFSAVALHGALSQGLRNRRLMALRSGQVKILVATDVAARGIDVPTITHVFNFGLPMKAEDYTHRIGRTGRAGRDGLAVTFAEFRDRRKIMDIEQYTHQPLKAETIPGMEPQQRFPDTRAGFGGGGGRGRPDGRGAPRGGNGGGRRFDGPREGGFGGGRDFGGPREGGFSYERKGGFNDRFAGQGFSARRDNTGDRPPARGGFNNGPREGGFGGGRDFGAPREGGFGGGRDFHAPREGGRDFGGPREGGFGGNRGGFEDKRGGFGAPRGDFKPAFAKPAGFGKSAGNGGKPFAPRDAKKRPARNFD